METDNWDDPFSSITALCHISDSQEDCLSRCPFAGNDDLVSDSEPSLCTGGLTTPLHKDRNRPEASSMAVSAVVQRNDGRKSDMSVIDGGRVMSSGRDPELGFIPEVRFSPESEQRSDISGSIAGKAKGFVKEFWGSEPKKFEDLGKDLCFGDASAESSSKRLKVSEQILALELASSSAGTTDEKIRENLVKVHDSLKNIIEDLLVCKNLEGESSENRNLKASDDLKSNGLKENETIQSMDTSEDNRRTEKTVGSSEVQGTANSDKLYRILPPWSGKKKEEVDTLDCNYREMTLLDVLKILKNNDEDDGPASTSILEILNSRGMTFPRPRWWPEGEFGRPEKTKKKRSS